VISRHTGVWVDVVGGNGRNYAGRNNMRSVRRYKELAVARQCPEKDTVA
jgi:hypothetical protein